LLPRIPWLPFLSVAAPRTPKPVCDPFFGARSDSARAESRRGSTRSPLRPPATHCLEGATPDPSLGSGRTSNASCRSVHLVTLLGTGWAVPDDPRHACARIAIALDASTNAHRVSLAPLCYTRS